MFRRRERLALLRVVVDVVVVVHGSRRNAGTGNRQRELRRNLVVVFVAISPVALRRAPIEILGHVHAHALSHLIDALLLARVRVVADVRQERRLRADEFIVVVDVVRDGLIFFHARRLKRRGDARDSLQPRGRCLDPRAGQREARGDRVRGCERRRRVLGPPAPLRRRHAVHAGASSTANAPAPLRPFPPHGVLDDVHLESFDGDDLLPRGRRAFAVGAVVPEVQLSEPGEYRRRRRAGFRRPPACRAGVDADGDVHRARPESLEHVLQRLGDELHAVVDDPGPRGGSSVRPGRIARRVGTASSGATPPFSPRARARRDRVFARGEHQVDIADLDDARLGPERVPRDRRAHPPDATLVDAKRLVPELPSQVVAVEDQIPELQRPRAERHVELIYVEVVLQSPAERASEREPEHPTQRPRVRLLQHATFCLFQKLRKMRGPSRVDHRSNPGPSPTGFALRNDRPGPWSMTGAAPCPRASLWANRRPKGGPLSVLKSPAKKKLFLQIRCETKFPPGSRRPAHRSAPPRTPERTRAR